MSDRTLKITVISDYGGTFENSPACSRLREGGHLVTFLREPLSGEALVARLKSFGRQADAILLTQQRTRITREMIAELPSLKYVLNTGRNFGHLDTEAMQDRGIKIIGGGGSSPNSPAELAWGLILASQRNIMAESTSLQVGKWQQLPAGSSLQGKTLGIYGLGGIGSVVATVGAAFGMNIIACGRENTQAEATAKGYGVVSKQELFEQSDVLSIHLKSTPDTAGIVTGADLALMKPTALFVNTSRAELVEAGALELAVKEGRPGRLALDVFDEEPVPKGHPLLGLPNVLLTPHIGYATDAALGSYYDETVANFLQALQME